MDSDFSRTVGRILGKGNPTAEERQRVLNALETANTWRALPRSIQKLLNNIKRRSSSPKTIPGGRNATTN